LAKYMSATQKFVAPGIINRHSRSWDWSGSTQGKMMAEKKSGLAFANGASSLLTIISKATQSSLPTMMRETRLAVERGIPSISVNERVSAWRDWDRRSNRTSDFMAIERLYLARQLTRNT